MPFKPIKSAIKEKMWNRISFILSSVPAKCMFWTNRSPRMGGTIERNTWKRKRIIADPLFLMAINKAKGSQKYPPKGMPNPRERSYPWGWISIRRSMNIIVLELESAKDLKAGINILVLNSILRGRTMILYKRLQAIRLRRTWRVREYRPDRFLLSTDTTTPAWLGIEK